MAQAGHTHDSSAYYFPHGSRLPFFGSVSLFILMSGAAATLNGAAIGGWVLGLGFVLLFTLFFLWFGEVIRENQAGYYNEQVDRSFRMGMMWFIFSEVMFFAAFFGALFYARQLSVPWLGGEGAKAVTSLLWPNFEAGWPSNGPGDISPRDDGSYEIIPAFGLPALNTALLLTSGLTITVAHHALKSGHRGILKVFLAADLPARLHLPRRAGEGVRPRLPRARPAARHRHLRLHVLHADGLPRPARDCVGAIMLVVIWLRCMKGHFTPRQHFAFEAVAWYWHFVDVVWLGLFIFVYWL